MKTIAKIGIVIIAIVALVGFSAVYLNLDVAGGVEWAKSGFLGLVGGLRAKMLEVPLIADNIFLIGFLGGGLIFMTVTVMILKGTFKMAGSVVGWFGGSKTSTRSVPEEKKTPDVIPKETIEQIVKIAEERKAGATQDQSPPSA